jgi:hypothetical protein
VALGSLRWLRSLSLDQVFKDEAAVAALPSLKRLTRLRVRACGDLPAVARSCAQLPRLRTLCLHRLSDQPRAVSIDALAALAKSVSLRVLELEEFTVAREKLTFSDVREAVGSKVEVRWL